MNLQDHRKKLLEEAKRDVKESVNADDFIIQVVNTLEGLDVQINNLVTRLREWYGLGNPEALRRFDGEELAMKILSEVDFFEEKDLNPLKVFATSVHSLIQSRDVMRSYLKSTMKSHCKNMTYVLGEKLAGKLIRQAGSLKKLAMMPAGTIQILGAEDALFRHLKTGAKPPKHGYILAHPIVGKAKDKGKAARKLSAKISHCARLDYFNGEFKAKEYLKELEELNV